MHRHLRIRHIHTKAGGGLNQREVSEKVEGSMPLYTPPQFSLFIFLVFFHLNSYVVWLALYSPVKLKLALNPQKSFGLSPAIIGIAGVSHHTPDLTISYYFCWCCYSYSPASTSQLLG